jgi:hypothetical protein
MEAWIYSTASTVLVSAVPCRCWAVLHEQVNDHKYFDSQASAESQCRSMSKKWGRERLNLADDVTVMVT